MCDLKPNVPIATHPDSFKITPLTPPNSETKEYGTSIPQLLDTVRDLECGRGSLLEGWHEYPLQADEYAELLFKVAEQSDFFQGFWENKLKYDYFPSNSIFVIRMASPTHERFIISVSQEVRRQLLDIASGDSPASEFARQLVGCGSPGLKFPDPESGRHVPDASFGHKMAQYPGVIFEVSYSQKRGQIKYLADDYILGSDGNIKAVVGLDIEYQGKSKSRRIRGKSKSRRIPGKSATISIWRPRIVESNGEKGLIAHQETEDLVFRHPDGTAVSSETTGLCLSLEDFAPSTCYTGNMNQQIFIPATTLTEFLVEAENADLMIKQGKGEQLALKGVRKIWRQRTPDEEIDEEDDDAIQDEERMVEDRMSAEDETWSPEEQN